MPDDTMTEQELAAIEARAGKATEGPWFVWKGHLVIVAGKPKENTRGWIRGHRLQVTELDADEFKTKQEAVGTAQFVAHARQDVPALCAALRAAWRENERLRRERDEQRELVGLGIQNVQTLASAIAKHEEDNVERCSFCQAWSHTPDCPVPLAEKTAREAEAQADGEQE